MSSVVMVPESRAAARSTRTSSIPFGRLLLVEWRKQLDTRASRWLLITTGIVLAVLLAGQTIWGGTDLEFWELLGLVSTPLAILLPVVGILAGTQEWSQRTGLVSFVLEPRRTRLGCAKLVAALLTGAVAVAAGLALSALAYWLLVTFRDVHAVWSVEGQVAWGMGLSLVLSMVQGVGFGLLLRNTPAAIVVFFVLPTAFALLGQWSALHDVWPWVDLPAASEPLATGATLTGTDWAHLASAGMIWVVAPLVGGLVRLSRSEIRSS